MIFVPDLTALSINDVPVFIDQIALWIDPSTHVVNNIVRTTALLAKDNLSVGVLLEDTDYIFYIITLAVVIQQLLDVIVIQLLPVELLATLPVDNMCVPALH